MNFLKHNKLILFFLLLLFFIVAKFTENQYNSERYAEINISKIKTNIFAKTQKVNSLINSIKLDGNEVINKDLLVQIKENESELLIFENDSLVFWSDNYFEVNSFLHSYHLSENKLVKYGNAWFLQNSIKKDKNTYITLLLLKLEYEYKNNIINNKTSDYLGLSNNVKFSNIPENDGIAITDINENFMFSIIPDYNFIYNSYYLVCSIIFYLFFFIAFLYLFNSVLISRLSIRIKALSYIILFITIRILIYIFKLPDVFINLELFNPHLFASSVFTSNLGEFIINVFIVFIIILLFTRTQKKNVYSIICKIENLYISKLFLFLIVFISISLCVYIGFLFEDIVRNSSISLELNNLLAIDIYGIIIYLSIALIFLSYLLFVDFLFSIFIKHINISRIIISLILASFVIVILYLLFNEISILLSFFFSIFIILSIITNFKKVLFPLKISIYQILVFSIYVVILISLSNYNKEQNVRKLLVTNLSTERDAIAEMQLPKLQMKLESDFKIKSILQTDYLSKSDELYNYITSNYFHGFWSKYDLQLTLCKSKDTLFVENKNLKINCIDYFKKNVDTSGVQLKNSNFIFLDNSNGRISYLGIIKYYDKKDSSIISLFLELDSKLIIQELGYPELLIEEGKLMQKKIMGYSYAKYRDKNLVSQVGTYMYNLNLEQEVDLLFNKFFFIDKDGYSHLFYQNTKNNIIVISKKNNTIFEYIVFYSYLFVLYLIIFIIYKLYLRKSIKLFNNFIIKMQMTFILIITFSMIIVGGGTIYYNIFQLENKQIENIFDKAQSLQVELDGKIGNEKDVSVKSFKEYLTFILIKFSNVFFSDINLYSTSGNLIASSRYEVFEKKLIGEKMNRVAFDEMYNKKKTKFVHKEKIANMEYLSAYIPFYNKNDKLLAYINLPYFTKESIIRNEISSLIITIINILVLIILIAILLTVLISNNITKPLRLIQKRMSEVQLGKKNEPIDYISKDEIGDLINQYNRLINELEVSAIMLAKSERELAWRNMAKQIAHEIKNPLTPMKLNIQFLLKSWEDTKDKNDWHITFKRITKGLIEQIDILSTISSEFSNFAKMPVGKLEKVYLINKIEQAIALYQNNKNIDILFNASNDDDIFIFVDNEQILRVFNNILKNSMQSLSAVTNGKIYIDIVVIDSLVQIEIRDNGHGIPDEIKDKIFTPNFTTKSRGMGLGLAMVKNIVENSNGKIWFKSEVDKGTSFFIQFPIV